MKRLRFVMIGGFLGAGKTTTLARLARYYTGRGQRVGLVTNDQAQDLVDTTSLRAPGLRRRGSRRRLLLLPVRRPRRQGRLAASERTARRDPRRAGRQLHRPRRHRRAAAARPVRRPLRGRALSRAVQAEPRAEDPARRDRQRLLAQGRVHLPQAARRGRRHRHQSHRRDRRRRSEAGHGAGRVANFPACRCCACRRRRARASRR